MVAEDFWFSFFILCLADELGGSPPLPPSSPPSPLLKVGAFTKLLLRAFLITPLDCKQYESCFIESISKHYYLIPTCNELIV